MMELTEMAHRKAAVTVVAVASLLLATACASKDVAQVPLPSDWTAPEHYACLRAYHLHQTLTKRYEEIALPCRAPADQAWAPAQTALASATLSMVITGALPPEDWAVAVELFHRAALSGEPVAMSLYGGLIGGPEGRRMIRLGVERGILVGATMLSNNGGRPFETRQQREDAYWASFVVERNSVVGMDLLRARFNSGPDAIPADRRQTLADEAAAVRLGPAVASPVSPQVTFEMQAAVSKTDPVRTADGKPIIFMRNMDSDQYNPTNLAFAALLSKDPQVVAVMRTGGFTPSGTIKMK